MDFVTVNGVTLAYRVDLSAPGEPLVFINSLGTDARIWDKVVSALTPRYRILSFDKRGHGLSDAPPGPYSLDVLVDDLAALLDHVGMTRATICGVSVGGMVAQLFALRCPERVKALILCNTAAKMGDAALWNARIHAVRDNGIASISDSILDRWFSPVFRTECPAADTGYRNMLERTSSEGYQATCAAIRDADLRQEISAITAKTLVVAGEHDRSAPPAIVSETAALLPNARFALLEGTGHIPSIEQPTRLAALIDTHIQEASLA